MTNSPRQGSNTAKNSINSGKTIILLNPMKTSICMLMTACILCACEQHTNPLLTSSELPYGAPPFSQIKSSDYLPAFEEGFKQHKKEIDAIASNPEEPNFANTIDALEKSGQLLARVEGIFYNINETDADNVMKETEKKITPIATDHSA